MTEAILLVACVSLAGAVVALATSLRRQRAESAQALAAIRAEQVTLERRLAALEAPPVSAPTAPTAVREVDEEFVITRLGSDDPEAVDPPDARLFADLVLRESVVKAASFAYGVRRGLSPANRNRIWFEMRREVKRARKERRAEEREAIREWRARQRAAVREDDAA